jgi:multisubunit Na+/H+ antiporter MnhC subunit
MAVNSFLNQLGTGIDKVKPFLADGPGAIKALVTNQPFPARTLVITLIVIAVACWVIARVAFPGKPKG